LSAGGIGLTMTTLEVAVFCMRCGWSIGKVLKEEKVCAKIASFSEQNTAVRDQGKQSDRQSCRESCKRGSVETAPFSNLNGTEYYPANHLVNVIGPCHQGECKECGISQLSCHFHRIRQADS
jgi:hypothetical protein